jgi:hypothetical protein
MNIISSANTKFSLHPYKYRHKKSTMDKKRAPMVISTRRGDPSLGMLPRVQKYIKKSIVN